MINKIKNLIITLVVVSGLGLVFAPLTIAVELFDNCSGSNSGTAICKSAGTDGDDAKGFVQNIISALLWLVGVVSVIMIIFGGIKYTTSNGDSQKIQSAKNTVMYAVIGVVVALVGQGVLLFVVDALVN